MCAPEVAATQKTIPAHRALAEQGVQQFYACEGLPLPFTLWLRSPVEGAIVADLLACVNALGPRAGNSSLWDIVKQSDTAGSAVDYELLLNEVRAQIWDRAWGMTAKEIGHQFNVNTAPAAIERSAHHYSVWRKSVGHLNNEDFYRTAAAPAVALADLERTALSGSSFPWEPDPRYKHGEAGRLITAYLDAFGYGIADSTQPPLNSSKPIEAPERTKSLYQIAQHCGWLWMFEGVCVLVDSPAFVRVDDAGRLHCDNGPAMRYPDGFTIYAWHGVNVPALVIETPALITLHMIKRENNGEVRRVMIERYGGLMRYAIDGGWTLVDELPADHAQLGLRTAKLWRGDEDDDLDEHFHPIPSMYVELLNSTPEPDGTTKRYTLRVDPTAYGGDAARYVQAAAASTWRNAEGTLTYPDWRDYAPVAES